MITCPVCSSHVEDKSKVCPGCRSPLAGPPLSVAGVLRKLDVFVAAFCLSVMILVVLCQIILRNFFHTGLADADVLVRHLVLWVVFLGAGIATRENRHIRIDVLTRVFPRYVKRYIDAVVCLFSAGVCLFLSYGAVSFVRDEFHSGFRLTMFNMPVWPLEIIIPVGYLIVTVHLLISGTAVFLNKTGEK